MATEVKLFNRWSFEDVEVKDIALIDYIAVKQKYAVFLPHTAGRYNAKRFRKSQCPIVERLVCSLMMKGRNNGKKLMATRIVKHTFEIIHLLNGENPVQVRGACSWGRGGRLRDPARVGHGPACGAARAVGCQCGGGGGCGGRGGGGSVVRAPFALSASCGCGPRAHRWVGCDGGRSPFGLPSVPPRGVAWVHWACRRGPRGCLREWLRRLLARMQGTAVAQWLQVPPVHWA